MKNEPVVIERTFNAPVSTVWRAITNRDEMAKWYFNLEEFRAAKGFEFHFIGGPDEGMQYKHVCVVTEVVPQQKLAYLWRYEGYEGISHVIFELFAEGAGTRLRLTHEGLETFPSSAKDFSRENFVEGWTEIIGTSLKRFVEE